MKKKLWAVGLLALAGSALAWQKGEDIPLFRVSSSVVLVDFVAVDKDGAPVRDLKQEEIEILEDGKKQRIESFAQPGQPAQSNLVRPGGATPGAATTATPAAGVAAPGGEGAQTIIVLDSRAIDSNNLVHSVHAIRAFVERHLAANHAIMIAEINRGLKVLSPLTRDKQQLLGIINEIRPQTVYNPLDAANATQRGAEKYLDELSLQVAFVRESLLSLCYSLAGQKGRKHVVYFSEGYPLTPVKLVEMNTRGAVAFATADDRQAASREVGALKDPNVLGMIREVVSAANLAGVSFYAVDARGLIAVQGAGSPNLSQNVALGPGAGSREGALVNPAPGTGAGPFNAATEAAPSEAVIAAYQLVQLGNLEDAQNTLAALAAGTNGLAFFNSNNLGVVLNSSTQEQQNYYLASYAPSGKRKAGQFHNIAVKTSRPNVRIRARMGYLEASENQIRGSRLNYAFQRPELFRHLAPLVQVEASRGAIRAVVGVNADEVHFRPNGDNFETRLSFQGMIYKEDGKPISKDFPISKGFNVNLTREQFQSVAGQPFLAQHEMKLPSGSYKLVLAVEDLLAGTMGTTAHDFRVP